MRAGSFLVRHIRGIACVAGLGLALAAEPSIAQPATGLEAFVGAWRMDAAKTKMGREGPNGANTIRSKTFTWIFSPTPTGLRMDVYASYPQPAPTRTMSVIPDGQYHPCQGPGSCLTQAGDPKHQAYAYYAITPNMIARLFQVDGKVVEYGTYAVAENGGTLTITSWNPETPEFQNVQVFDKQP